jgi:short-subunit dehydrogenase
VPYFVPSLYYFTGYIFFYNTGASSGIGQGTAILFSKLGAKLAITGRNDANLNKTADECEKHSGVRVSTISIKQLTSVKNIAE